MGTVLARLFQSSSLKEAEEKLKERLKLIEEYEDVYKRDLGIREYKRALSSIYYRLGDIFFLQGRLEEALKNYEQHTRLEIDVAGKGNALCREALVMIYRREPLNRVLNKLNAAKELLEKAKVLKDLALCHHLIAVAYAQAGDFRKARMEKQIVMRLVDEKRHPLITARALQLEALLDAIERPDPLVMRRHEEKIRRLASLNVFEELISRALIYILRYLMGGIDERSLKEGLSDIIKRAKNLMLGSIYRCLEDVVDHLAKGPSPHYTKKALIKEVVKILAQPY